jgi:hypothetical protein
LSPTNLGKKTSLAFRKTILFIFNFYNFFKFLKECGQIHTQPGFSPTDDDSEKEHHDDSSNEPGSCKFKLNEIKKLKTKKK